MAGGGDSVQGLGAKQGAEPLVTTPAGALKWAAKEYSSKDQSLHIVQLVAGPLCHNITPSKSPPHCQHPVTYNRSE